MLKTKAADEKIMPSKAVFLNTPFSLESMDSVSPIAPKKNAVNIPLGKSRMISRNPKDPRKNPYTERFFLSGLNKFVLITV